MRVESKRHSLHLAPFSRPDSGSRPSVAQKGHRVFLPGDYVYQFELPLDGRLPETVELEHGAVQYQLEAVVERAGAFRASLVGAKPVTLVRTPLEGSLDHVEPIAISRRWDDQLHYDIVISGKCFTLGAQVPIAFKLTPLAKVQCHRIRVFITQGVDYFTRKDNQGRSEPVRKLLLFEKQAGHRSWSAFAGSSLRTVTGGGMAAEPTADLADSPGRSNLLGNLSLDANIGPTELEAMVQLPGCADIAAMEPAERIHFDTTCNLMQVHHWIKVGVMNYAWLRTRVIALCKAWYILVNNEIIFFILYCTFSQLMHLKVWLSG